MEDSYLAIREMAKDLQLNENKYEYCPFCKATHEKKFSIKRVPAGILYLCFRASCGKRGLVGDIYYKSPANSTEQPVKKTTRVFTGALEPLPEPIYVDKYERYGIPYVEVLRQGIKFAPDCRRIYIPIFDYRGYQIGDNLRSTETGVGPKTLIYKWAEVPLMHYPIGYSMTSTLCVVEDQTSAIKLNLVQPRITTCALMGIYLGEERVTQLLQLRYKKILIMLDGDALEQSLRLLNYLNGVFDTIVVHIPKDKDPKDLTKEEIHELIPA